MVRSLWQEVSLRYARALNTSETRDYGYLNAIRPRPTRGMFGIRVRTGHKNTAKDFSAGKTAACTLTHVCVRSWHTSIRAEAAVRKRCCQAMRQQTGFAGITRHESSVREGFLCWTPTAVTGNYTYPEHTPVKASSVLTCPGSVSLIVGSWVAL
jgi:hypothetical protein